MHRKLIKKERKVESFAFEIKSVDERNYIIDGIFSTPDGDRHGESIVQAGWDLENYKRNPVVLWAHNNYEFPIAQMTEIGPDADGNLAGKMKFAVEEYDKAETAFKLMSGKFLRAFSVGFANNVYEVEQNDDIVKLTENELFEVSVVNVPANAMALAKSKGIDVSAFEEEDEKAAVPYADHGMADEDMAWDGPKQMSACGEDFKKLKAICAWYDETKPGEKGSYKMPHHDAGDMKAVWKGVTAAMGALMGSRGGMKIPEEDRKGVYNHLAKHYKQFGKEPPEFKSADAEKAVDMSDDTIEKLSSAICAKLAATRVDKAVQSSKVETPKATGGKFLSKRNINKAIRQLLKERKTI